MKFEWDESKNQRIRAQRGVSVEDAVFAIRTGGLLDVVDNPQGRYPDQRVLIVLVDEYVYLVPCLVGDQTCVLKTMYPSRKATRPYLGGSDDGHEEDQ